MTGRTFFIPALLCRMNLLLVCLFVFALCRPVLSYPLAQGLAVSPLFHLGFSTEMEASVVGFLSVLPIKRLFITPPYSSDRLFCLPAGLGQESFGMCLPL